MKRLELEARFSNWDVRADDAQCSTAPGHSEAENLVRAALAQIPGMSGLARYWPGQPGVLFFNGLSGRAGGLHLLAAAPVSNSIYLSHSRTVRRARL